MSFRMIDSGRETGRPLTMPLPSASRSRVDDEFVLLQHEDEPECWCLASGKSSLLNAQTDVFSHGRSAEFYDGLLKDAPKVQRALEEVKPGLTNISHEIIAASTSETAREEHLESATGGQARLHWIEMPTSDVQSDNRGSIAVAVHAEVFFEQIFPSLQSYFAQTESQRSE